MRERIKPVVIAFQVKVSSAYSYVDAEKGLLGVCASSVGLGIAMLFRPTLNVS